MVGRRAAELPAPAGCVRAAPGRAGPGAPCPARAALAGVSETCVSTGTGCCRPLSSAVALPGLRAPRRVPGFVHCQAVLRRRAERGRSGERLPAGPASRGGTRVALWDASGSSRIRKRCWAKEQITVGPEGRVGEFQAPLCEAAAVCQAVLSQGLDRRA